MKNLRFILVTLFVLISCSQLSLFGQEIENPKGEWQAYLSYDRVMKAVQAKDKVFALSYSKGPGLTTLRGVGGVLFSYDTDSGEYTSYSKVNGLSDSNISDVYYNKKEDALLIVYNNLNIDILYSDNSVANISDLKNSSTSFDFSICDVYMHREFAYLSTNSGIIVVDVKRAIIDMISALNKKITSICIKDQTIYASTENSILFSDLSKNIQEPASWELLSDDRKEFKDNIITQIFIYKDHLHFVKNKGGVFYIGVDNVISRVQGSYSDLINKVVSISDDSFIGYLDRGSVFFIPKNLGIVNLFVTKRNFLSVEHAKKDYFWVCSSEINNPLSITLSMLKLDKDGVGEEVCTEIKPDGPASNISYYISNENGRLFTLGGGYYAARPYVHTATIDEFSDGKWTHYDMSETISQLVLSNKKNKSAMNFVSLAVSPTDKNHIFVSSWGDGVYEYRDHKFVRRHDIDNSPLEDVLGNGRDTRIDRMAYDKKGNLWITNTFAKYGIKILKASGEWSKIYYPELDQISNIRGVFIDKHNIKWIIYDYSKSGLLILDEKGTFEDTSDDLFNSVVIFRNHRGALLPINHINSLIEDHNGDIWLGTDVGLFYIRPEKDVFKQDIVLNQVEIPRNDGSGYIDFLLDKVDISSIVIDKYNRKWIGTKSVGLYLLSEDGLKTIAHFTEDNSLLLSNEILSLAVDNDNGVLYVGTSQGLMSYKGELTSPDSSNDKENSLDVYPNPVKFKEFDDYITIKGISKKSVVKITDLNMKLILQKRVDDGVLYWDGRDAKGEKIATGTYLIFSSSTERKDGGKTATVTKLLVVD